MVRGLGSWFWLLVRVMDLGAGFLILRSDSGFWYWVLVPWSVSGFEFLVLGQGLTLEADEW